MTILLEKKMSWIDMKAFSCSNILSSQLIDREIHAIILLHWGQKPKRQGWIHTTAQYAAANVDCFHVCNFVNKVNEWEQTCWDIQKSCESRLPKY